MNIIFKMLKSLKNYSNLITSATIIALVIILCLQLVNLNNYAILYQEEMKSNSVTYVNSSPIIKAKNNALDIKVHTQEVDSLSEMPDLYYITDTLISYDEEICSLSEYNEDTDGTYYESTLEVSEVSESSGTNTTSYYSYVEHTTVEYLNESSTESVTNEVYNEIDVPTTEECTSILDEVTTECVSLPSATNIYSQATSIWNALLELGLNKYVCAGILGNIMAEVGGQTLDISNWPKYSQGSYYGICQWGGDRRQRLLTEFGTTLEDQISFLSVELFEVIPKGSSFYNMQDEKEAALYFAKYYERCGSSSYSVRQTNATKALEYFQE